MHWFTASDGTQFLVQTPLECARTLALAFPDPSAPATSRQFLAHAKKECPLPESGRRRRVPLEKPPS